MEEASLTREAQKVLMDQETAIQTPGKVDSKELFCGDAFRRFALGIFPKDVGKRINPRKMGRRRSAPSSRLIFCAGEPWGLRLNCRHEMSGFLESAHKK